MQYLSYADYQSMGGTASNTAFTLLEYKARMIIEQDYKAEVNSRYDSARTS